MGLKHLAVAAALALSIYHRLPNVFAEEDNPCKADIEKFCPGTNPGDRKFGPCMQEHKDDISDACKEKMKEKRAEREAKNDACRAEIGKVCPDMKPGDAKFGPCVKQHKDGISEGCRAAIQGMLKPKEEADMPCKAEAEKLCPGLKPGDGKFGPCMKEHKDDLSAACKDMVGKRMRAGKKAKPEEDAKQADKSSDQEAPAGTQNDQ